MSSLIRANLIIFTKQNLLDAQPLPGPAQKILEFLKNKKIPYLFSKYNFFYQEYDTGIQKMKPFQCIEKKHEPTLAVCGIGDSKSFNIICNKFFTNIVIQQAFADHYHYNNFEFDLESLYGTNSFSSIVTTYKDFIKLSEQSSEILKWLKEKKIRIFIIEIEIYIKDELNHLAKLI